MYKKFKLYNKLKLGKLFSSKVPIIVSEFEDLNKGAPLKILDILIEKYWYLYCTIIYDIYDNQGKFDESNFTWFFSKNRYVKDGIFVSHITSWWNIFSSDSEKQYVHKLNLDYVYLKIIVDEKLTNWLFNNLFFIHVNEHLLIYPHLDDFWYWIIDLSWKNSNLVRGIVEIFSKYWAEFIFNEAWKKYIKENNLFH